MLSGSNPGGGESLCPWPPLCLTGGRLDLRRLARLGPKLGGLNDLTGSDAAGAHTHTLNPAILHRAHGLQVGLLPLPRLDVRVADLVCPLTGLSTEIATKCHRILANKAALLNTAANKVQAPPGKVPRDTRFFHLQEQAPYRTFSPDWVRCFCCCPLDGPFFPEGKWWARPPPGQMSGVHHARSTREPGLGRPVCRAFRALGASPAPKHQGADDDPRRPGEQRPKAIARRSPHPADSPPPPYRCIQSS